MKNIIILGRKIKIKILPQEQLERIADKQYVVGLWVATERTIYLAKELNKQDMRYYLIHEAVHAMHHFTGIDQTLHDSLVEVICQSTATLFEDLLSK
jgi:Zn-dependent peptidase ImmA (M78 family)